MTSFTERLQASSLSFDSHDNRELKQDVFEGCSSTRSGLFAFLQWFYINFRQIVFIRERTLSSTISVAFRHFKWEKASLPVDIRRLKTCLLKFPNTMSGRKAKSGHYESLYSILCLYKH